MVTRFWARSGHPPGQPANQPVDGVVVLELVERSLGLDSLERVSAVPEPVGPRGQDLAPAPLAPFIGTEPVDHRLGLDGEGPKGGADFGDDRPLVAVADHPLVAGGDCGLGWPLVFAADRGESCGIDSVSARAGAHVCLPGGGRLPPGMVGEASHGSFGSSRRVTRRAVEARPCAPIWPCAS